MSQPSDKLSSPSFVTGDSAVSADSGSTAKSVDSTEPPDVDPDGGAKEAGTNGDVILVQAGDEKATVDEADGQVVEDPGSEGLGSGKKTKAKAKRVLDQGDPSDTEPDDASDDEGVSFLTSTITWASELQAKNLYEAYRIKLEKRNEERKKKGHKKADDQGPALLKSLADYLRALEKRIAQLETERKEEASAKKASKDGKDGDTETGKEEGKSDEKDAEGKTGEAGEGEKGAKDEGDELRVLQSFHDYRREETLIFTDIERKGNFCDPKESFIHSDPEYVLRVLFKWSGKQRELKDPQVGPDLADVEILGIRIHSQPIAAFLEKQAGFKLDDHSVLFFAKPFRVLIRYAAAIRQQLDVLEETHRSTPKTASPESPDGGNGPSEAPSAAESKTAEGEAQPPAPVEPVDGDTGTAAQETNAANETEEKQEEDPAQVYNSKQALLHFRLLVQFIDKYLSDRCKLFNEYQLGIPQKVAFENLWMLFDFGGTIYCPSRRGIETIFVGDERHTSIQRYVPQAYRVVSSVGGIPLSHRFVPPSILVEREEQEKQLRAESDPWEPQAQQFQIRQLLQLIDAQHSGEKAKDRFTPLLVYCYYIDYDGTKLSVVPEIFNIKPFDGLVEVASLNVFPRAYQRHLTSSDKSLDLHDRGLKFFEYTRVTHLEYDGLTVGETQEEITSPVMIDFGLAFQETPHLVPDFSQSEVFWGWNDKRGVLEVPISSCDTADTHCCLKDRYLDQEKARSGKIVSALKAWLEELEVGGDKNQTKRIKDQLIESDLCVLLPGIVYGFALHSRKWLQFDIGRLKEAKIADGESGWDDLVLPETHRSMVQSMVETHTAGTRQGSSGTTGSGSNEGKYDIGLIQGKGKGCIILLHGVPGVGKTSTAECVAAYTRRPLFPITCGDIGYEPERVEANLEKLFRLAHKWGCVMLIDEADVFLAERDKADVKRNGLVSVFLRVLEYYSGILFLTTNRVGAFDEAFRSRIHLSLYYPKLDENQSYEVWRMNIRRIAKLNEQREKDGLHPVAYNKKRILDWAQLNYKALSWNGRQIQNAFQTALALAEFEVRKKPPKKRKPEITVEHFHTIGDATIQFDQYLIETHMGDQAKTAKQKQIRADKFGTDGQAANKDREIQMPISHKSKTRRRPVMDSSTDTEDTGRESSSEEEGEGESDESEIEEKSKKKSKSDKVKEEKEPAKSKGKAEQSEKKGKASSKSSRSKKAKKDESADDTDAEEMSEDAKVSKKKPKKTSGSKGGSKKKKTKKSKTSSEEEEEPDEEASQTDS